ncbi:MAG TPA: GWxTD domain-containing protein [Gemmatimonadales bacterium]|nr:GWxTD domain-containing protein [Gemmatimonadales bacterium]
MIALLFLLWSQDSLYARADSLIAAHNLPGARRIAESLVSAHPSDAAAHLLLGRILYAWPVVGRYPALAEFKEAARLAPQDPEPLYWQIRVGRYLGSDEGEAVIREAALKIFALDPDDRDCWSLFEQLYHNAAIWRRADSALARHPDDIVALERRARIAIELEEPARADSFAAQVLAHRGRYVPGFLLRAEAAFDRGNDASGYAWYDSALAAAALDSTEALWEQVRAIASPAEVAREASLLPGDRQQFFEAFWDRRDPNLVTPQNERIAEHFRRLAEAGRMFQLLHPYSGYHSSRVARALAASYLTDTIASLLHAGIEPLDSTSVANVLLPEPSTPYDSGQHLTVYAREHLSGPGLVWLRHGRPDDWERNVVPGQLFTAHEWTYETSQGPITVVFDGIPGPDGSRHGDFIVAPPRSARAARQLLSLLTTDGTSLPATLTARGWSAFFKSAEAGSTDLYVRTAPESAVVVLWDTTGTLVVRARGPGVLGVTAPPGWYDLGLDVDSAGQVGRERRRLVLPFFSRSRLSLSSLALAPGDTLSDRERTLSAMPADLTFPAGRPLAAYTEVYGLTRGGDDRARYHARYTFTPITGVVRRLVGGASSVVFEFDRDVEWSGTTPERIVIEPGRLSPGRYRVTLSVTDVPSNVKSETVALEIAVR